MDFFADSSLADSSKKLFVSRIEKWIMYHPPQLRHILFLLSSPKRSIHYLKLHLNSSKSNTSTNKHCYISAIVALFSHRSTIINELPYAKTLEKEWLDIQKDNSKDIMTRRLQNKPTEKQEKKISKDISWSTVLEKRDALKRSSLEHLLFSFYTYIYPLRADFYNVKIVSVKPTSNSDNFIVHTKKSSCLYINNYKTSKKYGPIVYESLPSELHAILSESLKNSPRDFLFVDAFGKPFSRDSFSKWSNRIFSKILNSKISISILRHLFISTIDFNQPAEKLHEIGQKMGHSFSMQKLYQWTS